MSTIYNNEVEWSNKIHHAIRMMLLQQKNCDDILKIAIYPFGVVGQLTKRLLNDGYGLSETYLFDNELCKYNENVCRLDEVSSEQLKDVKVLVASDKMRYWDEIQDNVEKYFKEENIYYIFGKVCEERDVRYETLRLNAQRMIETNVEGSVAEVGVYKGDFAKSINKYFKNRKLYLFDTFEGFVNEKVRQETDDFFMTQMQANYQSDFCAVDDFSKFLSEFPNPEMCVIKKGFFPETTVGMDDKEKFAFVSIDVDIYSPTISALEFFYYRMSKGGIIMIHDYNNWVTKGVKRAVDDFCIDKNISPILVSDWAGSAIIIC